MKTKLVELYCDLAPNWHEASPSQTYVFAQTQPPSAKESGFLRVRILVDLPENSLSVPEVDATVTGRAIES